MRDRLFNSDAKVMDIQWAKSPIFLTVCGIWIAAVFTGVLLMPLCLKRLKHFALPGGLREKSGSGGRGRPRAAAFIIGRFPYFLRIKINGVSWRSCPAGLSAIISRSCASV